MKKAMLMTAAICLGTATHAYADPIELSGDTKRISVFTGSFITGAVAGGPLGAVAGMIAGAWLGDQVQEADRVDGLEKQLAQADDQVSSLAYQLAQAERTTQEFAQIALEQLQLELLFKTGDSALTTTGQQRMNHLAQFLVDNPELNIRLDGYADPRGDAGYNLLLSEERVASVASLLQQQGVVRDRIVMQSHGASQSSAKEGDYDGYALERVVKIQLTQGGEQSTIAQVIISQ